MVDARARTRSTSSSWAGLSALLRALRADEGGRARRRGEVAVAAALGSSRRRRPLRAAPPARSFLTVLAPVPLVFSRALPLQLAGLEARVRGPPAVRAAAVSSRTPVVLIVFDEFSTVSLMDRRQRIDAVRFPNFAALAGDSTWYRNATTAYWLSEVAVPSILSGLRPDARRSSRSPRSTRATSSRCSAAATGSRAIESLPHLCPRSLCRETRAA